MNLHAQPSPEQLVCGVAAKLVCERLSGSDYQNLKSKIIICGEKGGACFKTYHGQFQPCLLAIPDLKPSSGIGILSVQDRIKANFIGSREAYRGYVLQGDLVQMAWRIEAQGTPWCEAHLNHFSRVALVMVRLAGPAGIQNDEAACPASERRSWCSQVVNDIIRETSHQINSRQGGI